MPADRLVPYQVPCPDRCPRCGTGFACGRDGAAPCWCAGLPPLAAGVIRPGMSCLCPACLGAVVRQAGKP